MLQGILERLGGEGDPIAGLASTFFAEVQPLIETPWSVAILDFAFPNTRGQRPADFEITVNTLPPKGGGFGLRLEAGLIDPSGRFAQTTLKLSSGSSGF
jgi:hypothetical protein